ncbi:putative mitochondrial protein AtMg00310 [Apium graveolens]|uniref:putative mitochondrial protein AtMg00310 n=1 Tax=Apium graveolens TaxID=4045 RepID=UPI003D79E18E
MEVCDQLEVREAETPGRYLGLPMRVRKSKIAEFSFLLERVDQKLQGWDKNVISKVVKVTLLKTKAQAIPNFWMNMLIPNEVCEKIERRMNAYWWWSGTTTSKDIHWLSWEKLCVVKEVGGRGFKRLRDFNIAMLAKQAWHLINNSDPLASDLIKARWYPNSGFLDASLVRDCVQKKIGTRIWRMQLPGKVINFLWRTARAILPAKVALQGMGDDEAS